MSKLSYKTLFTIFFFLLIGVVILSRFILPKQKVSAAWWNEMWHHRRAISVTNSSGSNQTNIQVKILDNYDLSALVTASKIQSDLDDIRFTDINGNLINYWIEDSTNNSVDIWGIVPTLPTSGSIVYLYYGNPSATSLSNSSNFTIGGTMTSVNGYRIHTFLGNGTLTNTKDTNVEVLVVGGGGGGGSANGVGDGGAGGGGAGGLTYNSSYSLTKGQIINVTVGTGGTNGSTSSRQAGSDGGNSIFGTITSNGGGGGAASNGTGRPGGSGGGGGYNGYSTIKYGGAGVVGIGNSGGNTTDLASASGGGGGGANGVGENNKTGHVGGDGGLGSSYSITGVGVTYATGGRGGGGAGPVNKTANTGNGGDGSYANTIPTSGASGIVVVRYLSGTSITPSTEEVGGGAVAYWKFDEGSGTTTYNSSGTNNGTLLGSTLPTWQNEDQCISGKCLNFSGGTNTAVYTNNLNWNILKQGQEDKSWTLSVWAKPSGIQDGSERVILGRSGCHGGIYASSDSFRFAIKTDACWTNAKEITYTPPNMTDWYFLTAVYNNRNMTFYVNGKSVGSTTFDATIFNYSDTIYIGGIGALAFKGLIDEPKIYTYARTADQIKQDYNSRGSSKGSSVNLGVKSNTSPTLNSKLIAYYKFDEGVGSITNDSSPQKKSGSFTGTTLPTWSNNCKQGKCVNFTSTNANKISTNTIYNNGSEYTISAFIYPTSTGDSQFRIILGSAMGNNIDSSLVLPPGGGLNICYHNYSGSGDTNYCSTNNPLILNKWQHVALTFKDNDVNVYHNGIKIKNISIGKTSSSNYALIGGASSDSYGGARFFDGLIDEVKIYNTALTDEEIKQDYNQGSSATFGITNQTIGGTTTSLEYCIPGDTSYCASPIAEWNFEENTGTSAKDISGNNNTGIFATGNSAPTWTVGKKNNGAGLNFDGNNDYLIAGTGPSLNITNAVTVESWVNLNSLPANWNNIVGKGLDWNTSNYNILVYSSGAIRTTFQGLSNDYSTGSVISTNKWYHIATTYDGSYIKIYSNGVLIGSTQATGTMTTNTNDLNIGRIPNYSGSYLNGKIDNIRIYNYARTPAQVAYDYNKGGPAGWWKLDECQGLTAFDSSGSGYTGTISVGPSGNQNTAGTCQVGTSAAWTNGASGKYNGSLSLDGQDDYMSAPISVGGSEATVAFWAKNILAGTGPYLFRSNAGTRTYIGISGSNVYFTKGSPTAVSLGSYPITPSKWNHILLKWWTSSGVSYAQAYINGNAVNIGTSFTDNSQGTFITIAGFLNNGTQNASGQFDDIRVYNYALTNTQIKTLYNGGSVNFQ